MNPAVIVDGVRTPIGRSHPQRGWFRKIHGDELAACCLRALLSRTGLDPVEVEDVVLGCARQHGEQAANVARIAALRAGLPATTAAATVNRLCGSSLQAIHQAAHAIAAGAEDVHVAGGLEQMTRVPAGSGADVNPKLYRHTSPGVWQMGLTAEYLARQRGISRQSQDEFALRSHRRAAAAQAAGDFVRELVPVYGHDENGLPILVARDQCVRNDTSLAALAALPPAFVPEDGTVTAGNSSPINDGAATLLLMSETKARSLGLRPLVRIRATAVAGVDPCQMGLGPVPATAKALSRAGLRLEDMDLIELNEAFAAQALACLRELGIRDEPLDDKVNVRGGAIALGHPLGASGARLVTTLLHCLRDRQAQFGLATMCIGLGQGAAMIVERV